MNANEFEKLILEKTAEAEEAAKIICDKYGVKAAVAETADEHRPENTATWTKSRTKYWRIKIPVKYVKGQKRGGHIAVTIFVSSTVQITTEEPMKVSSFAFVYDKFRVKPDVYGVTVANPSDIVGVVEAVRERPL